MTEITINLHDQPCGNCTVCIGRTIGAKHEQERIIKLLENRPNFCSSDDESCFEWLETGECDCKDLIALIKGEK